MLLLFCKIETSEEAPVALSTPFYMLVQKFTFQLFFFFFTDWMSRNSYSLINTFGNVCEVFFKSGEIFRDVATSPSASPPGDP